MFWFWNSFLPICLLLLLLGIDWNTTVFIWQVQYRPSGLLKQVWKTEQKFPGCDIAASETSSPRFQLVMLPSLLEISTPSDCQLQNQLCSFLGEVKVTAVSYSSLWYQLLTRQKNTAVQVTSLLHWWHSSHQFKLWFYYLNVDEE